MAEINQVDRYGQRILEVICLFADETDFIRIRETMLDRMLDESVLCEQKGPNQEETEDFERAFPRCGAQDSGTIREVR